MLPMKKSSHESALRVKQHFLRVIIKRLLFVSSVVNDVDIPRLPEFFRADGGNVPRDGGVLGCTGRDGQPDGRRSPFAARGHAPPVPARGSHFPSGTLAWVAGRGDSLAPGQRPAGGDDRAGDGTASAGAGAGARATVHRRGGGRQGQRTTPQGRGIVLITRGLILPILLQNMG